MQRWREPYRTPGVNTGGATAGTWKIPLATVAIAGLALVTKADNSRQDISASALANGPPGVDAVTGMSGFTAPALFGMLIETGSRGNVFVGYAIGAILVLVAAAIALRYGVDAERRPLEEVATPLSAREFGDKV